MHMQILNLKNASKVSQVGGKAHGLFRLIEAGFKVPPGFVIPMSTFLKMTLELESAIMRCFDELGCCYVAVRSSAASEDGEKDAWAGQLSTYLNTNRAHLLNNIELCWASASSKRAESYAAQKAIKSGAVSVVVQAMIHGDVSGVAFSVHPVTRSQNDIVIEACLGLGEALVSGSITPDLYVVSKKQGILERQVAVQHKVLRGNANSDEWSDIPPSEGAKQKLDDQQITALADIVMRVEDFFGYPVDIEWTLLNREFYLLQCRPITTLSAD